MLVLKMPLPLLVLLLLPCLLRCSSVTYAYQAFNTTLLKQSQDSMTASGTFTTITVPIYSDVTLQMDLRHLPDNFPVSNVMLLVSVTNLQTNAQYNQTIPLSIGVLSYSVYAAAPIAISSCYSITGSSQEETIAISYLFAMTVSATVEPVAPKGQPQKTFLFGITNEDLINLPYNMISASDPSQFQGYFLTQKQSIGQIRSTSESLPTYSDFWNGIDSVTLPYLPYFSNCANEGKYLYFSQLIHNSSECTLYGTASVPINQFEFGSNAIGDTCDITRQCVYDEQPGQSHEYTSWNTLAFSTSAYLFYVSAEQTPAPYSSRREVNEKDYVSCKLTGSAGTNTSGQFPMKVSIQLGYYQVTNTEKRMLTCDVQYSLYVASGADFKYELEVKLEPLNHTKILLNFGFHWYIYIIVFIIIGLVSNLEFILFWIYHLATTIKPVRHFNLKIYLRLIKQILIGVLPAFGIIVSLTFLIEFLMNGTVFGRPISGSFHSFWDYIVTSKVGYFADDTLKMTRSGRMGFAYMVISGVLMFMVSDHLIGKERRREEYEDYSMLGRTLKPKEWNQGKFLFGSLVYILICMAELYFTYTSVFSQNIWLFIGAMQVFGMVAEEITSSIFNNQLPCLPLKITLGVLSYLATMGAIDLYYFILGYIIDVAIATIETAYLSQLQSKISAFIEEKLNDVQKFWNKIVNSEEEENDVRSQKDDSNLDDKDRIYLEEQAQEVELLEEDDEELYTDLSAADIEETTGEAEVRRAVVEGWVERGEKGNKGGEESNLNSSFMRNEEAEKEKKEFEATKFGLIIDLSANMVQYMLQPIVVLILWITYSSSGILANFQISEQTCILYFLSSIILAVFYQVNVILIFHVLELYLNFDYKDIIRRLLHTSAHKTTYWITDQNVIDTSIEIKLRGTKSYSLHPQMFLLIALFSCSMYLFILGCTTIFKANYNPFKDPFSVLISAFWIVMLKLLHWLTLQLMECFDVWGHRSLSDQPRPTSLKIVPQHPPPTEAHSAHAFDPQTQHMMAQDSSVESSSIRFTFKHIGPENNSPAQLKDDKLIMESKLKNICKNLEPEFSKESFRLQYARKNKEFIRENIEKILPLVKSFPEDDAGWFGRRKAVREGDTVKKSKSVDPLISYFLSNWLRRAENNRSKRQSDGVERERALKKCSFCFNTWNLYYGYEGLCLSCSKKLFQTKKND